MSVARAEGDLSPHPSAPGGIEADVADVTTRALARVADAVTAQERLRSEVVRLVLLTTLGTAAVTAGLCVTTIVALH